MSDPKSKDNQVNTKVRLTFEQRARAVALESDVSTDEYATAAEIIYLRDELARLKPPELTPRKKQQAVQAMYDDLVGGCVND